MSIFEGVNGKIRVLNVVGARPNFMKVAPLHRAFEAHPAFASRIVHTGQHYDARMSDIFFRQLEMPEPHVYLGVGSGTHAEQTARVMVAFERIVLDERPDLVVVVGDVNSTLACSLVAAKCHVPVAHVEAGLRSGDRTMPEEINRIATDAISDFLFVTEQSGLDNLRAEGVPEEKIFFVGNVMIDALVQFREKAARATILEDLGLTSGDYALMTMHRPSNVDRAEGLQKLLETLEALTEQLPVVFPIHPRTRNRFADFGLAERLAAVPRLHLLDPLGYLEFLRLMEHAAVVVTDSGGIQEETTYLQVPCLTLRENTERPVTLELGTNALMPLDPGPIARRVAALRAGEYPAGRIPPLWDGQAARRIVDVLAERMVPDVLAMKP
ncbi:MAG: UDP-N-acetyl glucosamine 2-epimerase [Rhodothermaceae bacterium]|nr:MAG: UDP-N-acetyl glucosamine 2-epimerase [Rhodothermaceae bacterium]